MTLAQLASELLRTFIASERPFYRLATPEFSVYCSYDKQSGSAFASIREIPRDQ